MAAFAWSGVAAHGEGYTGPSVLGRDLYYHHSTYRPVYALFNKLDFHNELYNAV